MHTMNDDAAIRRANLARLCKVREWSAADLHRLAGRSYSFWPQLLNGPKSFGEKLARALEEQLDLPRGWLDQQDDVPPLPAALLVRSTTGRYSSQPQWLFSVDLFHACDQLDAAERRHLENIMRAFVHLPPISDAGEQPAAA